MISAGAIINYRSRGTAGVESYFCPGGWNFSSGFTALMVAVQSYSNLQMARLLLENGADPDLEDEEGRNAIVLSTSREMADLLIETSVDQSQAKKLGLMLINAVDSGDMEEARRMIDAGADVNMRYRFGWTALYIAADSRGEKSELVELLLQAGADPNIASENGRTPLSIFVSERNKPMVRLLLDYGADPNVVGEQEGALAAAARLGYFELIRDLLQAGADPNIDAGVSWRGLGPLHEAARLGWFDIVHLLLESNADVNDDGVKGNRVKVAVAARYAANQGHKDIVDLLMPGLDPEKRIDVLVSAARSGAIEIVETLLDLGTDPGGVDLFGVTPLAVAEKQGQKLIADILKRRIDIGEAENSSEPIAEPSARSIELVFVEKGSNRISQDGNEKTITVDHSFYMGRYEVTQSQWFAIMGYNPSPMKGENHPAFGTVIDWYDALRFCNRLSINEGFTPVYSFHGSDVQWNRYADGYRLPTEAEWTYAAGGGPLSHGYLFSGGDDLDDVGWYRENSVAPDEPPGPENPSPSPVGKKMANELGLFDMSGNVWEYCWDVPSEDSFDTHRRIIKGGAFDSEAEYLTTAFRDSEESTSGGWSPWGDSYIGFRVVRNAE